MEKALVWIYQKIKVGSGYLNRWTDFTPHIGDLLSNNKEVIENHKLNISVEKWIYVEQLAEEYANNNPGIYRYGDKGLAVCNL